MQPPQDTAPETKEAMQIVRGRMVGTRLQEEEEEEVKKGL
jgi:hypothetical protein